MNSKKYFIILAFLTILLGYNILIYNLANKRIYKDTKDVIGQYFKTEKYDYLKATLNEDNTFNIFLKLENKYYRVILTNDYKITMVNEDIPPYIKKAL